MGAVGNNKIDLSSNPSRRRTNSGSIHRGPRVAKFEPELIRM